MRLALTSDMSRFLAILISLGFFALASLPVQAYAGGCSGSGCGGNFSATEFKDLMSDAVSALKQLRAHGSIVIGHLERTGSDGPADVLIDPEVLKEAFTGVSVVDNTLYLNGKVVNFLSNPDSGHVDFTEKDWANNPQREKRLRMVIHELLMLSSKKHHEYDDYLYNEQLSRAIESLVLGEEEQSIGCPSCTRKNREVPVEQLSNQVNEIARVAGRKTSNDLPSCGSTALMSAPVGAKCTTSKGAVFERVAKDGFYQAWKGPDGLIWSDLIAKDDATNAKRICEGVAGALPSESDFERGENYGVREVITAFKGRTFWSSTLGHGFSLTGNAFDTFSGDDGNVGPDDSINQHAVLCVTH